MVYIDDFFIFASSADFGSVVKRQLILTASSPPFNFVISPKSTESGDSCTWRGLLFTPYPTIIPPWQSLGKLSVLLHTRTRVKTLQSLLGLAEWNLALLKIPAAVLHPAYKKLEGKPSRILWTPTVVGALTSTLLLAARFNTMYSGHTKQQPSFPESVLLAASDGAQESVGFSLKTTSFISARRFPKGQPLFESPAEGSLQLALKLDMGDQFTNPQKQFYGEMTAFLTLFLALTWAGQPADMFGDSPAMAI